MNQGRDREQAGIDPDDRAAAGTPDGPPQEPDQPAGKVEPERPRGENEDQEPGSEDGHGDYGSLPGYGG